MDDDERDDDERDDDEHGSGQGCVRLCALIYALSPLRLLTTEFLCVKRLKLLATFAHPPVLRCYFYDLLGHPRARAHRSRRYFAGTWRATTAK